MKFLLLLLVTISSCYGYNILVMFAAPSHSHNSLGKGIVDSLLKEGHTVTWVTPYPEKVKNPPKTLKILDVSPVRKYFESIDGLTLKMSFKGLALVKEATNNVSIDAINTPAVKETLIKQQFDAVVTESFFSDVLAGIAFVLDIDGLKLKMSLKALATAKEASNNVSIDAINTPAVKETLIKQQFDAVVTESFFSDVLTGVAAVQQAPWILLAGTQMTPQIEAQVDQVNSVATIPLMFNPSDIPMGFASRSLNAVMCAGMTVLGWFDRPTTTGLYEQLFGPIAAARGIPLPPFDDAFYNVSIMFVNSHESIAPVFSTAPNVVNIAGYHMEEEIPPLPKARPPGFAFTLPVAPVGFDPAEPLRFADISLRRAWNTTRRRRLALGPDGYQIVSYPLLAVRKPAPPLPATVIAIGIPVAGARGPLPCAGGLLLYQHYGFTEGGEDLQDLLDGSPQGVVYFSMGSVLKSARMTPPLRAALLKLFASLPYTVLWKFEEPLTGLPPNVHVRPWMPQPSILAHKNIKVFITHGGQLSSLEAVRAGVPLLAIPVFGDQPANADRARRRGYALKVPFSDDMVPELEVALKEMLSNDKYSKQAKHLSHLFQSRPATPRQLVNHYITLAIETKGAYHLRSVALQYRWYERWMLDFAFILLAILAVLYALLKFVIKLVIRKISGKKTYKDTLSKKRV